MNIVITMAGLGERFLKAGYKQPKYEIEVHGKTLFEWSLLSLAELNKYQDVRYFFVVRKGLDAPNFVRESCERLSIKDYRSEEHV